ncbi:hypothetical protein PVAND_007510 [Polypedilum vanderplanki]|uniref:Secreted protein n=1 Tax=Polypedilum vanderplanki TaxID=319348 RepID=A0A9J6C7J0_POLVA|nr:hypothetical protein PVAND_007510 [Polypedilum vanderplanki]
MMNYRTKLNLIAFILILLSVFVVSHPLSGSIRGLQRPTLIQQKLNSKNSFVNTEDESKVPDVIIQQFNQDESTTKKDNTFETKSTSSVIQIDSTTTHKVKSTTTEYTIDYADGDDDDNLSAACIAALCSGK